ncbi:uncharacterized protein LOC124147512 isoform X2 [Haliotis rufescens]|uniref:uncharacterized protein LOC124147512 isoform X2 n=1 Tax=Haliotis rufescens TaxID=6454 RepID=UPI00201EECB0|nr:uncharacterized protein LOC124147512 isoform X2 [Haliotis rufescens]
MMDIVLLTVVLLSFTSGISGRCPMTKRVPNIHRRWPYLGIGNEMDDSKSFKTFETAYKANDMGLLLGYPPGVGQCGGRYPIWRKEMTGATSVVCFQNETSTCFKKMHIPTYPCSGGTEAYRLKTDVVGSVFCFEPNPCYTNPCQNGGTCIKDGYGFTCNCADGYSGPSCQGDPCINHTSLPGMDKRRPSNKVKSDVIRLRHGWYGVPKGAAMPNHAPRGNACGSKNPIWSPGVQVVCQVTQNGECDDPQLMKTKRCGNTLVHGIFSYFYAGNYCFECNRGAVDLLIIEDISTSVVINHYEEMKTFVLNFVNNIDIRKERHQIAFVTFAATAKVGFYLNTYDNKTNVQTAISSQRVRGGNTFLGDAIKLATSDIFNETNGDRPDAENIVVLFTDGMTSNVEDVRSNIGDLHARAEVYVVCVTSEVDKNVVAEVASPPVEKHDIMMKKDDALSMLTNEIFSRC